MLLWQWHMKCVEANTNIIRPFWSYHYHSNRNILSYSTDSFWWHKPMLCPTDCPIKWFSLPALILEYSLPQFLGEYNWRFWSHCPGWCSESEPELDNTKVSNYPGSILTYKQSVMSMIWLSWVTVVPVWSPCTMTTGASNYYHFPHSMGTCSWSHTSINELSVH